MLMTSRVGAGGQQSSLKLSSAMYGGGATASRGSGGGSCVGRMVTSQNIAIGMKVRPGRHWRSRQRLYSGRRGSAGGTSSERPAEPHASDQWYAENLAPEGAAVGKIYAISAADRTCSVEWTCSGWLNLNLYKDVFCGYRIGKDGFYDLARWTEQGMGAMEGELE